MATATGTRDARARARVRARGAGVARRSIGRSRSVGLGDGRATMARASDDDGDDERDDSRARAVLDAWRAGVFARGDAAISDAARRFGRGEGASTSARGAEARDGGETAAATAAMEYALFKRRFLKEARRAEELTFADACALSYGVERVRAVFARRSGVERGEDDGGWCARMGESDWQRRFEKMTSRDAEEALGEMRGMLAYVEEKEYVEVHGTVVGDDGVMLEAIRDATNAPARPRAARAECPLCGKTFTKQYLPTHVAKAHTGVKPVECSFPRCRETFADVKSMERHVALVHDQKYKCRVCAVPFSTQQMLKRHEQAVHNSTKSIPCPVDGCEIMFKHVQSVAEHIRRAHTSDKPYACSYPGCTRAFASKTDHDRHHRTHFGEPAVLSGHRGGVNEHLAQTSRGNKRVRTDDDDVAPELTNPLQMSQWLAGDD